MPLDQEKVIPILNELRLTGLLEPRAPASVIQIQPKFRLNLISVDSRNMKASKMQLKITYSLGILLTAFEPRFPSQATGVVKGVDTTINVEVSGHTSTTAG